MKHQIRKIQILKFIKLKVFMEPLQGSDTGISIYLQFPPGRSRTT